MSGNSELSNTQKPRVMVGLRISPKPWWSEERGAWCVSVLAGSKANVYPFPEKKKAEKFLTSIRGGK